MVVGPGPQICKLLEVWVLGVGMSTIGAQTVVHRGSGAPSTDDPGAPGSDPRIRNRIQIVMFRPIRVDHTNCL